MSDQEAVHDAPEEEEALEAYRRMLERAVERLLAAPVEELEPMPRPESWS